MQRLQRTDDPQHLQNKHVHFHIQDVCVPHDWRQILAELHGQDLLQGRVVDLSDSGAERGAFAVVEVDGLKSPVVVPVAKIVEVGESTP
jgi:hypothetical protein